MKHKTIITSCLVIIIIVGLGVKKYVGPILIRHSNMAFDDNTFLLARAISYKKKGHATTPTPIVTPTPTTTPAPTTTNSTTTSQSSPIFTESFNTNYTVEETGDASSSKNPLWWVNSGGYLYSINGVGNTIMGALSGTNPWRVAYFLSNPIDTDNGYYPQNIFRLVLMNKSQNYQQDAYFQITKDNLSGSSNRNASNGLFFFNRYQDAFNVYYTGLRVDGYAVIKKKIDGIYYTMAYKPFIKGIYDRDTNPDLLPKNTWIGMRSVVTNNTDGTVNIKVYADNGKTGNWALVAEAIDDGKSYGGAPILSEGYAGIRTDFMDTQFDDYTVTGL